ncbi:helix-turn-helix domain-containing protein [Salmonella enterica]|uniref:helix-turn-helix domain-containing protein n=1 Tax=Salmonella enterica TaxID=28901 RepID=UPI0009AF6BA9|nr:helix-turn-helix domain-containing protein [Salmonella enterica]EAB9751149.1 XRE family transcriptional regulator [Salmonella enterica subsp. salamae]EBW9942557.1 XRE family transcriptional regulator [Salmonella enterica subsp. enterica serovar Give]EBZ2217575.1 XRE family transcriptional regulator [Salmonella enterica subsp. enterica serovar Montevideo]ECA5181620.1 XRE family transcriptional regulator [Salmonella enterica subsp. enterica serovar Newport]ECB3943285.1 XRE family transcriptio
MVDITTQSSGMGKKIRAIRDAEKLTRLQFFEMTGIPAGTQKYYETGRVESIGSDILLKITQHPCFSKYTLWLMTGKTAPQAGQIAPALAHIGPASVQSNPSEKQTG